MTSEGFDLPAEHSLQAQFWLTPLATLGKPATLGSVRISRVGDDRERACFRARVTHWAPPPGGLRDATIDSFGWSGPRFDGRAGDMIGMALSLARARRDAGPGAVVIGMGDFATLVALARRAPRTAGDRGHYEGEVIERAQQIGGLGE